MEKNYSLFIDTLNLLLLPKKEVGVSYISLIQNQIEELEGDFYTFLHKDNITQIAKTGFISIELVDKIEKVRGGINEIEDFLWNPIDFIDNHKWKDLRNIVLDIFKTIN